MNGTQQQSYWLKQLSDPSPLPNLPWDKEPPPVSSFVRETVSTRIPSEVWRGIKDLATRAATTPHAVLLAAIKALLFRYTGQTDIIIGTLLSRNMATEQPELVALRTRFAGHSAAQDLVSQIAASLREANANLGVTFRGVLEMLEKHLGHRVEGLFNVALIYSEPGNNAAVLPQHFESACAEHLTACALVFGTREVDNCLELNCEYDAELLEPTTVERLTGHIGNLLAGMAADPQTPLDRLSLLGPAELGKLLVEWNATQTEVPMDVCIHQLIEARAQQTPESVAVVCRNRQLTFAELNARANQVASYLSKLGVGTEVLVGLCLDRSLEMLVGLLGILKAGGAYLPLDPAYPSERLAFILEDARVKVVLTQEHLLGVVPSGGARRVRLDADWPLIAAEPRDNVDRGVTPRHLAYVLYTSGSTGKPKGVMVEHSNVVNFFVGMDARIPHSPGAAWLAVTSPSFDISVLELFWTLARGFKVVLFAGDEAPRPLRDKSPLRSRPPMEFSLFYFSSDQTDGPGGAYRLLTAGARFADERGFVAVWTPERHFHEFGGLYPNPSVTSAALAMITRRVQIRSGSVVAPLHSPIRIAEEWSVVDNLSNGRVAISFASGWMPEDFTVNPANYANRKEVMFHHLDVVRRLWRGERVEMPGPLGKEVAVKIFPRPVQKELPLWLTAAGNPETFEAAGRLGTSLLTHLLGQSIEEVSKKVALYRKAWKEAGHAGRGHVTLMLHTFVGESMESVKATVRQPLIEYLRKSADLIKGYAWAFSGFKHHTGAKDQVDFSQLSKDEMDAILEHAFDRYFETSGLFGTPESCLKIIERLRANDIDEVACLIDFGVAPEVVVDHLEYLDSLRRAVNAVAKEEEADYSIPALIERHRVTHLQCTPSMAGLLLLDERTQSALGRLQTLLLGGEAFPVALAKQLRKIVKGDILNMYGPTETTIWSSTYQLPEEPDRVPVGRPIANTDLYVLDHTLSPVPVGIAGELMIGGAGVARGYLGRPELTAERFIRNPFRNHGLHRLYRTGDLARYLPDGNVELLGRLDHQVKIRGHRIELGEIEATFNQHPMVRESVVIAKPGPLGDAKLIAYVVPSEGQKPGTSQLRSYIKDKLPDYMVPAHVVLMTAFPQTPNKKIDRKALPAPDASEPNDEVTIEVPTSEIEGALCELYAEVLQVGRVGRNDDFFELGGDSLSAVQLLSRIRQTCKVELPLERLFDSPTVAGLAENLEALCAQEAPCDGIPTSQELASETNNGESKHSHQLAPALPQVYEPPRTPTGEKLAKVWAEAPAVEPVGRDDNFFASGGNSPIASQLATRLESVPRVRLPLETLFNPPTVRQLAAFLESDAHLAPRIEEATAHAAKPALPGPSEASFAIARRKDRNELALSSGQQRLWFLQELEGGCHYNDHFNLRLTGGVNVSALERSIQEILMRHEAMRARFTEIDGQPVQRIESRLNFTLPVIDLRQLPAESRLTEAIRLAVEEARRPFDLAAGPLWRFHLVVLADEDHLLLITAHHIAIDGWSRGVFLNELCALYKAFLLGRPSPLLELPIQYTDYAAWQSEWLKSAEYTRQLDYWKQRLAGTPPLLELPCDRPRPPIQSFRGARRYFTLPRAVTAELRNLCRQEKVTFFMTLLAGFQSLLHRYTGQDEVLIGTPVANRPQKEIQGLIGYFLNTVVLRGDCSGAPTFRQVLKRVRATSLEAFGNQDLPLEKLIDALQLERNLSYSPLFQVFFVLQNVPAPDVAIPGLSVRPFEIDNGTAKFDLSVSLFETDDGLTGWLEYATDLFDAATMERLPEHYRTLLEAAVASPDMPVSHLPLLTPGERKLVLEKWNQTGVEYPSAKCVHELVEEQAALFPDRIAVEFGGGQMTYAELDRRTTLLASHLQSLGVGPDSLVCLCLERSLNLVVGVLGVLKAGGAYVPLDPGYPNERLAFILADADAKVLLTETTLLPTLSGLNLKESGPESPAIVCLDQLLKIAATDIATRRLDRRVRPENLAYVIYTSGSTGKPKGVQVEHRSVVNLLDSMRRKPGFTTNDVLLAVTTLCFDIAGLELFLPLTTGARVLIASRDVTVDGLQLARLVEQSGVTVMQATPATWRLLLEAGWKGNPSFKILCGGEAWTQDLAEALLTRCGSLWNMYGPTETTIWSAVCEVTRGQPVLIGPPIANTQFYVLDKSLQPVPAGVPGELHIGGDGVARGYANRPALTSERFVADPFAGNPSARMYKSGDLVRYLSDGKVEYLGRIDHQVKVRGFRIELGEIESALAVHPALRENVVVVRQDQADEKQLAAYIVAAVQPAPTTAELRQYLLKKVPDYMVPSAFVLLPALPRLTNGKIDRKALPAPEADAVESVNHFEAPATAVEETLTAMWCELLGAQRVSRRDNFFECGGDSLLAMRLVIRIRLRFGVDLPLKNLFEHPTVAGLAEVIDALSWSVSEPRPVQAVGDREEVEV